MKYYPVYLELRGRTCVVVGVGDLAFGKAETLLEAGAQVTVIGSPSNPQALVERGARLLERAYRTGDFEGAALAIWADMSPPPTRLRDDATKARVLLNVVDRPRQCDFIAPAVVRQGDLHIAISTSGASPALAKRIRQDLERVFGDEYAIALKILRKVRHHLERSGMAGSRRQEILKQLAASPICRYLRDGRRADVEAVLAAALGPEVPLACLDLHEYGIGER